MKIRWKHRKTPMGSTKHLAEAPWKPDGSTTGFPSKSHVTLEVPPKQHGSPMEALKSHGRPTQPYGSRTEAR